MSVPGKPLEALLESLRTELQYSDSYLLFQNIISILYRRGQEDLASMMSLPGNPELKLRGHFSCIRS